MGILTKEQITVEKLLPEIRATHAAFLNSGKEMVDLAKQIGDRLWTLKECVKKGEWEKVVQERCEFSIRTAQTYMKLAGGWEYLEKKQALTTTIDGCVKLIGQAKPKSGGKRKSQRKPPNAGDATVPASGEAADANGKADLGKCPNCQGKKWVDDGLGNVCAKCKHPHGEALGDMDEQRKRDLVSKTVKTADALMRCLGDLNDKKVRLKPKEHDEAIRLVKLVWHIAKDWLK